MSDRTAWIDVTDVPPGDYTLRVELNFERLIAELDYDDNVVDDATGAAGAGAVEVVLRDDDPCLYQGGGVCVVPDGGADTGGG